LPLIQKIFFSDANLTRPLAAIACNNSGHEVAHNFPEARKIVNTGVSTKPLKDYELSRYACYLIVLNGDPRKEVIALGQTYSPSRPIGRK
jgi:hypothetical protein